MKAIFFFFWNLITGMKRAAIKLADGVTASPAFIYSIEATMLVKQRRLAHALPNRQNQPYNKRLPFVPLRKDSQNRPPTEWQIWNKSNKPLYQSSA